MMTRAPSRLAGTRNRTPSYSASSFILVPSMAGKIEENPIGLDQRTDFTNALRNAWNIRGPQSKEVEIARRTVYVSVPREKEHRALEHEAVLVSGLRQAIEKPLNHPSTQKVLEVLASFARQRQELCAIRSGDVRDLSHTADSR